MAAHRLPHPLKLPCLPFSFIFSPLIPPEGQSAPVLRCLAKPKESFLVAQSVKNPGVPGSIPGLGKIPWRRKWQPTPVFLPGESQDGGACSWGGWGSGRYSPQGCRVAHDLATKPPPRMPCCPNETGQRDLYLLRGHIPLWD